MNIINVTPLEPGWEDMSRLNSNTTPLPAKIYANEGVAQFVFIKGTKSQMFTLKEKANT